MPVVINWRTYCEYSKAVCLTCPGHRWHEEVCRLNPKNIKKVLSTTKKVNKQTKELEILPQWEWKDLSRLDLSKVNKPVYTDSQGNPFN
jgi:hypothetical protein